MLGKVRLQSTVDIEVKGETSKVESEGVFGRIIDSWMSWAKRRFNLLDGRNNFGWVKMHAAVAKTYELHVEDLDGFETLSDGIENQSNAIQRQINDNVTAQWILWRERKTRIIEGWCNHRTADHNTSLARRRKCFCFHFHSLALHCCLFTAVRNDCVCVIAAHSWNYPRKKYSPVPSREHWHSWWCQPAIGWLQQLEKNAFLHESMSKKGQMY